MTRRKPYAKLRQPNLIVRRFEMKNGVMLRNRIIQSLVRRSPASNRWTIDQKISLSIKSATSRDKTNATFQDPAVGPKWYSSLMSFWKVLLRLIKQYRMRSLLKCRKNGLSWRKISRKEFWKNHWTQTVWDHVDNQFYCFVSEKRLPPL